MAMTKEQQRALAIARARQRAAQGGSGAIGAPQQQAEQATPGFGQGAMATTGPGDALQRGMMQGATFGLADEITAGLMTPIEMGVRAFRGDDAGSGFGERVSNAYGAVLDDQRGQLSAAREAHPGMAVAGDVAGAMATGGQLMRGGATLLSGAQPTYASMAGRGAAEGALYGAAHGFGAGEGAKDRATGAAMGAGIGAITGGAFGAYGARGAQRGAEQTIPSTDALRQQANALYQQADQAGVVVNPRPYSSMVDDLVGNMQRTGIDPTIHPKATAALNRLVQARDQPLRLQDIDTLRRVVGSAAKSVDPDERRIASMMIDRMDDFIDKLGPQDVSGGDVRSAAQAIRQARDLWSRFRKGEVVENLAERAGVRGSNFSGSGQENALRSEFRTLSRNPKKMRGFSADEKAAIKRVAQGGPVENAARALGRFAPTGVVSTGLSGGMGYAVGGPVGSAALMGAGLAGRGAATAMTRRNAALASALIRSGGQMPSPAQLTGPQRALIEALTGTGAVAPTSMSR